MHNVYLVKNDALIHRMFTQRGWTVVTSPEDADLIQFTGGADVHPSYYNEEKHAASSCDPQRDAYEANIYHTWVGLKKMAGICRGGQFLNVMNGGSLWQHVNNHAISPPDTHKAVSVSGSDIGSVYEVTSTHHQMIRPSDDGRVLLVANVSSSRQTATQTEVGLNDDCEAVLYNVTNCLCYQPHPEFVSFGHECQQLYFQYLEEFFF